MKVDLAALLTILLGGGGLIGLASLARVWLDLRAGARAGQREVVSDLISWRDDLEVKLRSASRDRDYWRDLAARRGSQVRALGAEPAEPDPVPPSERGQS